LGNSSTLLILAFWKGFEPGSLSKANLPLPSRLAVTGPARTGYDKGDISRPEAFQSTAHSRHSGAMDALEKRFALDVAAEGAMVGPYFN
jgi:hypothetical protein